MYANPWGIHVAEYFVIKVSHSYTNVINCLSISVRKNPSQTELPPSIGSLGCRGAGGIGRHFCSRKAMHHTPSSHPNQRHSRRRQVLINQLVFIKQLNSHVNL